MHGFGSTQLINRGLLKDNGSQAISHSKGFESRHIVVNSTRYRLCRVYLLAYPTKESCAHMQSECIFKLGVNIYTTKIHNAH